MYGGSVVNGGGKVAGGFCSQAKGYLLIHSHVVGHEQEGARRETRCRVHVVAAHSRIGKICRVAIDHQKIM